MLQASELRVGRKIIFRDEPFEVLNYDQKVVGRGGSIINIKMKGLISGTTIVERFGDSDKFEEADVSTSSYDYLYNDGNEYIFMNRETFEQVGISAKSVGNAKDFLIEGQKVMLQEFNGSPINLNLEPSVVLEVVSTPPGEKGDTVSGGKKPAEMNTGTTIQVPLFINNGEKIKVDTRTYEYLGRA